MYDKTHTHTDIKLTVTKEEIPTHRTLNTQSTTCREGPCGDGPGSVRRGEGEHGLGFTGIL